MAKVDPFVVQWPRRWMSDPEIRPVIEYLNRFLHDLFIRTGGGTDVIETGNEFNPQTLAALNQLREQIGSGDALTSDETGFTVDTDKLTVDMTEA